MTAEVITGGAQHVVARHDVGEVFVHPIVVDALRDDLSVAANGLPYTITFTPRRSRESLLLSWRPCAETPITAYVRAKSVKNLFILFML